MEWNQILAIILIFIVMVSTLIWFWRLTSQQKREVLEKIIFSLVLEAEIQFGGKTGEAKYAAVVRMFYSTLPKAITKFISPKLIRILIENAVLEMKEYLNKNPAAQHIIAS